MPQISQEMLARIPRAILASMLVSGASLRQIGQQLGNVSRYAISRAIVYYGLSQRTRKDCALTSRTPIGDHLFREHFDKEQSWLLGLLLSDGCISQNYGVVEIVLCDQDGVDQTKTIIGMGKISLVSGGPLAKKQQYRYRVFSRTLGERLHQWMMRPNKSRTLQMPNTSNLSLNNFCRGLWDGDGYWTIDKRNGYEYLMTGIGSACRTFTEQLQTIIDKATGIKMSLIKERNRDFWKITKVGAGAIQLAAWMYAPPQPCLKRKHDIVKPWLSNL